MSPHVRRTIDGAPRPWGGPAGAYQQWRRIINSRESARTLRIETRLTARKPESRTDRRYSSSSRIVYAAAPPLFDNTSRPVWSDCGPRHGGVCQAPGGRVAEGRARIGAAGQAGPQIVCATEEALVARGVTDAGAVQTAAVLTAACCPAAGRIDAAACGFRATSARIATRRGHSAKPAASGIVAQGPGH